MCFNGINGTKGVADNTLENPCNDKSKCVRAIPRTPTSATPGGNRTFRGGSISNSAEKRVKLFGLQL